MVNKIIEIDMHPDSGYQLSEEESKLILARVNNSGNTIKSAVRYSARSDERGKWLAYGNLALVPTSRDIIVIKLPLGQLTEKYLYLYQFSGLVTTPADNEQPPPFFGRAVKNFLSFILFPVQLVVNLWAQFFNFVLGQGHPSSVTKGWIAESDLEKVIYNIPQVHKPRMPHSFLPSVPSNITASYSPEQTGLGIWAQADLSKDTLIPLVDPERILSADINKQAHNVIYKFKNGYPQRLYFGWLSNNYSLNDGSCYGSFIYFEQ